MDDDIIVKSQLSEYRDESSLILLWLKLNLVVVKQLTGVNDLSAGHLPELALADEVVQDLCFRVLALELSLLGVELLLQLSDVRVLACVCLMLELSLFSLLLHLSLRSASFGAKLE